MCEQHACRHATNHSGLVLSDVSDKFKAAHLFFRVSLLDEGGPDGAWGNGIASDTPLNEVGSQRLGEGGDCSLHTASQ